MCLEGKVASEKEFAKIRKGVELESDKIVEWCETQSDPEPETATLHVFSENGKGIGSSEPAKNIISDKVVMVDAINHALSEELEQNDKMVVYGQDVADDKGGVFTATKGLSKAFGKDRVYNAPLAESSIIGTAIGMACAGWKPVVEIQFADYIWTAMMQIRNELVTIRYRSNNDWSCPVVIRVPVGGYIHGGLCHSQSIDGYFIHMPGIRIAYPSTAADAKGLLKMACRMDDPVMFMEHKGLYRHPQAVTPEPDENYLLPFGVARVVQEGDDLTIVTWGMMVHKSVDAAKKIQDDTEASIEIIDLRTLNPLDLASIEKSLNKTNKVLVVYEDNLTNGPGAEISALIADRFFELLDGPVRRVAAQDCHVPFSAILEDQILPQTHEIVSVTKELLEY
jgi:2-oxoisovalerate dehydrogenase E1 component